MTILVPSARVNGIGSREVITALEPRFCNPKGRFGIPRLIAEPKGSILGPSKGPSRAHDLMFVALCKGKYVLLGF
jgi:hypothetical protein